MIYVLTLIKIGVKLNYPEMNQDKKKGKKNVYIHRDTDNGSRQS